MIPPALFFFLKIDMSIYDLLSFCMNFITVFSISVKNAFGILIVIALKL